LAQPTSERRANRRLTQERRSPEVDLRVTQCCIPQSPRLAAAGLQETCRLLCPCGLCRCDYGHHPGWPSQRKFTVARWSRILRLTSPTCFVPCTELGVSRRNSRTETCGGIEEFRWTSGSAARQWHARYSGDAVDAGDAGREPICAGARRTVAADAGRCWMHRGEMPSAFVVRLERTRRRTACL